MLGCRCNWPGLALPQHPHGVTGLVKAAQLLQTLAARLGPPHTIPHPHRLAALCPAALQAYKDSGDTAAKKHGDRIWIAEMYGYAFGAANLDIWHKWSHNFMLYPAYTPSCEPACMLTCWLACRGCLQGPANSLAQLSSA